MRLAIIGASGFIGQHLVTHLLTRTDHTVIGVARHQVAAGHQARARVEHRQADLLDGAALATALADSDVVVNLAAPEAASEAWCDGLATAVLGVAGRPLVHCSTAVVVGRARERAVTEQTPAAPMTPYEVRKLAAEARLIRALDGRGPLFIARPTVVFGPGGRNLCQLAASLQRGGVLATTARRLLFGDRPMHLVPVDTVARALTFLAERQPASSAAPATYQIAADEDPENHYRAVERRLADGLGVALPRWPPVTLPPLALSWLLAARGRSDTDPHRRYLSAALARAGFQQTTAVGPAVEAFGRWLSQRRGAR